MMPTISTIIPAYNAVAFIRETLELALSQTGVTQEIIVVDDGSTDGTWELLAEYGDRIRRVQQQNAGPAAARNRGARLAQGEWLAFLDADDLWSPGKLAKQLALATDQTVVIYTDRLNMGETPEITSLQSATVPLREGRVFQPLLLEGNFITLSSAMIRKRVFDSLGGFNETPVLIGVEDWELWLRAALQGEVAVCREPLVQYRWHAGGISRRTDAMKLGQLEVIERALQDYSGNDKSSLKRLAVAKALINSAWYAALNREWGKARAWYLQAAWQAPFQLTPYKGFVKSLLGRA